jgi:hypothetical protein
MAGEIESYDPSFEGRLISMEAKGASFDTLGALKDAKSRLSTGATGLWSRTYPAGFWIGEPCINATPISASAGTGQITLRVTKTLTAGSWKVDVQFTMLPASVSVLVLGTVTLGTSPGTVLFDYSAAEPNAA